MTRSFSSVMTGLVPVIPMYWAKPCHDHRDRRVKPGDDTFHRSRDAIRTRVIVTRREFLRSPHRSSPENAGGGHRHLTIFASSHVVRKKKARKRNADRRVSNLRTLRGAARAERCALASRRPTTALARGTSVPKAQLQARLPGTWFRRALPGVSCPSPVAAPHTPVVMPASMMPKAAREWQ
jgi:hypothetical protein